MSGEHVFRPSGAAYRRSLVAGGGALVIAVLGLAVSVVAKGLTLELVATIGALAIAFAYVGLYLRRARVEVGDRQVWVTGAIRRRTIARSAVAGAVLVDGVVVNGSAPAARLYLVDAHGRRLAGLNGGFWTDELLQAIVTMLAVPTDHVGVVTATELRRRHRRLVAWPVAHPYLFAVSLVLVLVVVIVAVAIVVAAAG